MEDHTVESINQIVNPKRTFSLLRIGLIDEWRSYMLAGLIIGCLILFTTLLDSSGFLLGILSVNMLLNIMLLIGLVQVSKGFSEIRQKERGIYYFMIPASLEEKYLVKLISTLVLYFIYALLICFVANRISIVLANLINDSGNFQYFDPFHRDLFDKFKVYLFLHAVFFSGSLVFKKNNFLKTAFVLIATFFILTFSIGLYLKNTAIKTFESGQRFNFYFNNLSDLFQAFGIDLETYLLLFEIGLYVAIPLMLYGFSYIKFKKIELRGE